MKNGKRHLTDGMEVLNRDKIRTLGRKETFKYLGILEADIIKEVEMKEKIKKEYLKRTRKLLETKLCCWNLSKGINTWAVPHVRYSAPFLKWTREEHKQMVPRTKKKWSWIRHYIPGMTLTDYVSRKEGGRGLAITEDSVDASIQRLEDHIEKQEEGLITAPRNDTDNTKTNRTITMKQKWEENNSMGVLND